MGAHELHTLVNLLDDPDVVVYMMVASRFLEEGSYSIPYLEKEWVRATDDKKRERIENLIEQIYTNEIMQGLQQWLDGPRRNLLEGAYWVAKRRYPKLALAELEKKTDDLTKDIWVALADERIPPLNKINIFNNLFFRKNRFGMASEDPLNPTYCFINRVLETKRGNDASLGLLYLHIAQQLGLPIYGVCAPGLFLLAYTDSFDNILCYINPINKGAYYNKDGLTKYLTHHDFELKEKYYETIPNAFVLLRLLEFIVYAYEQSGNESQAAVYRSFIALFGGASTYLLGEDPL